jgi:hypothetical protein
LRHSRGHGRAEQQTRDQGDAPQAGKGDGKRAADDAPKASGAVNGEI